MFLRYTCNGSSYYIQLTEVYTVIRQMPGMWYLMHVFASFFFGGVASYHTVDGRNPAPPGGMYETL